MHLKEIKVQLSAETLAEIDALVGDKNRSKFIRAAVAGALDAAKLVKTAHQSEDK